MAELLEVEESDLVESLVKRVIASGVEVRANTLTNMTIKTLINMTTKTLTNMTTKTLTNMYAPDPPPPKKKSYEKDKFN